jgi:hypothetical protein
VIEIPPRSSRTPRSSLLAPLLLSAEIPERSLRRALLSPEDESEESGSAKSPAVSVTVTRHPLLRWVCGRVLCILHTYTYTYAVLGTRTELTRTRTHRVHDVLVLVSYTLGLGF